MAAIPREGITATERQKVTTLIVAGWKHAILDAPAEKGESLRERIKKTLSSADPVLKLNKEVRDLLLKDLNAELVTDIDKEMSAFSSGENGRTIQTHVPGRTALTMEVGAGRG